MIEPATDLAPRAPGSRSRTIPLIQCSTCASASFPTPVAGTRSNGTRRGLDPGSRPRGRRSGAGRGGSALELYTGGAYVSGDLDFVGSSSPAIDAALVGAGFERSGRHWVHEKARIFVEFPSSDLGKQEAIEAIFGRTRVRLLSPEDLVVDPARLPRGSGIRRSTTRTPGSF